MPSSRITAPAEFDPVLQGGGACGALMRAVAWHSNALGAPSDWPQELRTVVAIALGSTQPMLIVWGREQITLYNDGYAAMCGSRHPAALGRPFRDLWFDIWERVDPIISAAFQGISTSMDDIEFIMHRNGYPEETHFAFSYTPVRDSSGAVLGMFCACAGTTAQVTLQRRLAKEREQLRQIFERALGAVAILSGPDHVFTFANNDYRMLVGHRELVGRTVAEALPEVVEQGYVKLLDTVLETGEAYTGRRVETELRRTPGAAAEKRLVDFVYHPIGGPDGRAEGIFVQAIDMTERVSSEHQQHLLNLELAHRMKNQLALVQAIAGQTLRSATDLGEARESLNQRLAVLARAQDMLLAGTGETTTVDAIVRGVTSLHDDPTHGRFRISGPALRVAPRAGLSLSLMLHELATNAAKYGALSGERGSVDIAWRTEGTSEGDVFLLEWEETGGPTVAVPTRIGSGTRLLKAGISGARFSRVSLDYPPAGACCRICVDTGALQA